MFYVYILRRPDNGAPFYVGKGKGNRLQRCLEKSKNAILRGTVCKIIAAGSTPIREVVLRCVDENEAFAEERRLVLLYGRRNNGTGILANMTDGGEGPAGRRHTEEAKIKNRDAHIGRRLTEEHKRKIGAAGKGRAVSEETRRRQSLALTGRKMPPPTQEAREKISKAHRGRKHTEAAREAYRNAALERATPEYREAQAKRTAKQWTPERRAAMSEWRKRKWADQQLREQTRAKISEAAKKQWADPVSRSKVATALKAARGDPTPAQIEALRAGRQKRLASLHQ